MNPQFMSFSALQTGTDTATSGSVQPPVSLSTGENLAMEVIKVLLEWTNPISTAANGAQVIFTISTKNFGTTQPTLGMGDATVIARFVWSMTLTTSGATWLAQPLELDLSDGAGHGLLIGNQNLYWTLTSASTSVAVRIGVKMFYRAKRISDSELLGIVLQSNQN